MAILKSLRWDRLDKPLNRLGSSLSLCSVACITLSPVVGLTLLLLFFYIYTLELFKETPAEFNRYHELKRKRKKDKKEEIALSAYDYSLMLHPPKRDIKIFSAGMLIWSLCVGFSIYGIFHEFINSLFSFFIFETAGF